MAVIALFAVLFANPAASQTASVTAVCTYATWTFYKGLSPCQVWGNLQAACNPNAAVPKLDTSTNVDATYPSPLGANATACQCTVVAYNLMAGCSWCQPNVYTSNWVSESQWKAGCTNYDPTGGLPSQASSVRSSIPPWALLVENGMSWDEFDASSVGATSTFPAATLTAPGFSGTAFGTAGGFGTATGPSFPTDPFSGGDNIFQSNVTNVVAKSVGITVGIIGGILLITYGIVLGVFMARQKNRKAWYGPTAEFYRNGGQMGDIQATQPLLASAPQTSNPFTTPSPSAATASFVTTPYQPTPSPPNQYDPSASLGQGYTQAQYQQPPIGQYDPNANIQSYPQYYDPNHPQISAPHTVSTQAIPQV